MNSTLESSIKIDQIVYPLKSIDEFGFSAPVDLPAGIRGKGLLTLGNDKLEVGFRVRENLGSNARCSFSNLSLVGSELIQNFLRQRHSGLLENATAPHSDRKPAKGNKDLASSAPELDPKSDTLDSSPATDASKSQAVEASTPTNETRASHEATANGKTQANSKTQTNGKTAANQWELTKSFQTSSAQTTNSARYIPAVAPLNAPSQTIAPQAINQAAPEQAIATNPPVPSAAPSQTPTPPSKTPAPETIAPGSTASKPPVHETVARQASTPKATSEKIISTPTPPSPTTVALENVAPRTADVSKNITAPKAAVVEPTSTPRLAARRSEVAQPATESSSVSPRSSNSAADRASRRANSARPRLRRLAIPLIFALTGLCLIAAYFLRSDSPNRPLGFLSRGSSASTDNFLPVTVKADGEVVELMVAEGDTVTKGDILMRLENPSMQDQKNQLAAQLTTAQAKTNALKRQLESNETRIKIAAEKLSFDLEVAKSEKEAAATNVEIAKINLDRMKPALDSGAITRLEFEEVRQELSAAKANQMTAENSVKQIEFAQIAVKNNFLINGVRFNDDNGRLTSELEIAAAEQNEMETALAAINDQLANLNVRSPRDGTVSTVYRQVGEIVKVADETVRLSFDGNSQTSLTEGKSIQNPPKEATPHQHDLEGKGIVSDKVAADM